MDPPGLHPSPCHVRTLEWWRREVGESIVDSVTLELPEGPHRVEVRALGDPSGDRRRSPPDGDDGRGT